MDSTTDIWTKENEQQENHANPLAALNHCLFLFEQPSTTAFFLIEIHKKQGNKEINVKL